MTKIAHATGESPYLSCDARRGVSHRNRTHAGRVGLPIEFFGIKIDQENDNSVFHFHIAYFMQVTLPTTMLPQITREAFAHQNVTCVATVHHTTRSIDSYSGKCFRARCSIPDVLHRPAMDSHPDWGRSVARAKPGSFPRRTRLVPLGNR